HRMPVASLPGGVEPDHQRPGRLGVALPRLGDQVGRDVAAVTGHLEGLGGGVGIFLLEQDRILQLNDLVGRDTLLTSFEDQRPHLAGLAALLLQAIVDVALHPVEFERHDLAALAADRQTLPGVMREIVRKHYRDELDTAATKAVCKVAQSLYKKA